MIRKRLLSIKNRAHAQWRHPPRLISAKGTSPKIRSSSFKDKSDYVKVILLGTIIDGNRAIERAIKLHASTEYGFPTTFARLARTSVAGQIGFSHYPDELPPDGA